jgi:DNA-binding CsgD family transcriptional regulator
MYDKVTLQNNYNNGTVLGDSNYQNGSGVLIVTEDDYAERQAEFIMKGGTIRGNINNVNNPYAVGGGVYIQNFGIFRMEGGVIMNNIAQITGGGFHSHGYGTFKKTGGIIYGSNAPLGLRNRAVEGIGTPLCYGHAVSVSVMHNILSHYRNDTVKENDNLSYTGAARGNGVFGIGEKWDTPERVFQRDFFIFILPVIVLILLAVIVIRRINLKKRLEKEGMVNVPAAVDLAQFNLSALEKELFDFLLNDYTMKYIASALELSVSGVKYRSENLYGKLGVNNRREMFVRFGGNR